MVNHIIAWVEKSTENTEVVLHCVYVLKYKFYLALKVNLFNVFGVTNGHTLRGHSFI